MKALVLESSRTRRWLGWLGYWLVCLIITIFVGQEMLGVGLVTLLVAVILLLLGTASGRKFAARDLSLATGAIRIGTRTITAQQVLGLSSCRSEDGAYYELALQEHKAASPTLVRLENESDLQAVTRALAGGQSGTGAVTFFGLPTAASIQASAPALAALLGSAGALYVLMARGTSQLVPPVPALFTACATLFWALREARTRYVLSKSGLHVTDGKSRRWPSDAHGQYLPYGAISAIKPDGEVEFHPQLLHLQPFDGLRLNACGGGIGILGTSSGAHGSALIAQLADASRRARGEATLEEPSADVLALLRRNGRSIVQWQADLRNLPISAGAYRSAGISRESLWQVADDVDAPLDARMAAFKLLTEHPVEEDRVRIGELPLRTHTEGEKRLMLRIATGDWTTEDEEELARVEAAQV
jgi:hypothetical protein